VCRWAFRRRLTMATWRPITGLVPRDIECETNFFEQEPGKHPAGLLCLHRLSFFWLSAVHVRIKVSRLHHHASPRLRHVAHHAVERVIGLLDLREAYRTCSTTSTSSDVLAPPKTSLQSLNAIGTAAGDFLHRAASFYCEPRVLRFCFYLLSLLVPSALSCRLSFMEVWQLARCRRVRRWC